MNKLVVFVILAVLLFCLADLFLFKRTIYPVIFNCIPSGRTGNYFKNDKCCPGSKVHMQTIDEGPPVGNGRFTCE